MSFAEDLDELVSRDESGLLSIHSSWTRVPLGEIATITNGFPFESQFFSEDSGVPLIRIRDVVRGTTRTLYSGSIPEGFWVETGDILVGMDGDFACARWQGVKALLNQRVCRVNTNASFYSEGFLVWALGGYLKAINRHTSSVTVKHLSSRTLAEIPLPLPPLSLQKRIADLLDSLLGRLAICRTHLERASAFLKRFRQAVLEAGVSGALTAEWREGEALHSRSSFRTVLLGDLISEPLRNGKSVRDGDGPWVLRLSALKEGRVNLGEAKQGDWSGLDYEKYAVEAGDFLISRGNGSLNLVGRGGLVEQDPAEVAFPDTMIRVRPDARVLTPQFLRIAWGTRSVRSQIEQSAKTTAGIWKVSQGDLETISLPVPALPEQAEIVRRIEALFSFADSLEARIEATRAQVERLTPALLAKAFRGELVPQEPGEGTGAELLARIRAGRGDLQRSRRMPKIPRKTVRRSSAAHQGERQMRKSRNEADVKDKPYLATLLRQSGGTASAETLFSLSGLAVADFYKQLAAEIKGGFIRDDATKLEMADAP